MNDKEKKALALIIRYVLTHSTVSDNSWMEEIAEYEELTLWSVMDSLEREGDHA